MMCICLLYMFTMLRPQQLDILYCNDSNCGFHLRSSVFSALEVGTIVD